MHTRIASRFRRDGKGCTPLAPDPRFASASEPNWANIARRRGKRRRLSPQSNESRTRAVFADRGDRPFLSVSAAAIYNAWVMIVFDLPDETATAKFAARVAARARVRDIIALRGDLGAGKTSFARAFIRACGNAAEDVPSPTFTLVQVYQSAVATIWHFDLYRLGAAADAWELGIEEAFADGISLIEWPERLGALLPPHRLEITLEFGELPLARRAACTGGAQWGARLAEIAANA